MFVPVPGPKAAASGGGGQLVAAREVSQPLANALDGGRVLGELCLGCATVLEDRPHVDEPLQLEDGICELSGAHAAASAGTAFSGSSSTSAIRGFDSTMTAASRAPTAPTAART